jgi:hypothetical protein
METTEMPMIQNVAQPKRPSAGLPSSVTTDPGGWITRSLTYRDLNGREPLTIHGNWTGPHKLVQRGRRYARLSEVFVDPHEERDLSSGGQEPDQYTRLIEYLVEEPPGRNGEWTVDHWHPPAVDDLADSLRLGGYEPTTDEQNNLRLTVRNRGCDGQILIRRAVGCLRLTMPIGTWDGLDPPREQAMLKIARRHNNRVRLVRIVWDTDNRSSRRCTAQVDLTGLPSEPDFAWFWSGTLHMAIAGLELTLHQIGKELDVLADPRHERVVAWLLGQRQAEAN